MNGTVGDSKHGGLPAAKDAATISLSKSKTPTTAEALITQALRFLSTASTETLCGIAVGLAACTYLVLGRVGLILIGALGGVVLHAAWESQTAVHADGDLRREKGLDIVKRILDLRGSRSKSEDEDAENETAASNFEGFPPETAAVLNDLVQATIRDYVNWWYHPILPKENAFPAATRQTLTKFITSIYQHLSRKRSVDTFLDFLTNTSSIVIVFLNELSSALAAPRGDVTPAEAVYAYLSANPESNLANVLSEKQQSRKLRMVAEDVLQNFLEKQSYDCGPGRVFLTEILAGVGLETTLTRCSKPEWINEWIVYLLEAGEPDISQAIDAGMVTGNDLSNPFDEIDGNVGNVRVTKLPKLQEDKEKNQEQKRHRKRLSKAEEAMEEAMEEAKRLSLLIAQDDAKKTDGLGKSLQGTIATSLDVVEKENRPLDPTKTPLTNGGPSEDLVGRVPPPGESLGDDFLDSQTSPKSKNITPFVKSTHTHAASPPTSFDQIVPQSVPVALQADGPVSPRKTNSLTLHNASIIIHDDSTAADRGRLRSKPSGDYLVQIEPESSQHPGWMIMRKYSDFETLHEVLRRIAQISGVTAFSEQHHTLPSWKEHTKTSLRGELERYLRDACWYIPLAESEGMKRFLEKDQGQSSSQGTKTGFTGIGWPTPSAFETMGKGMLDVLTSAPKGAAEGGKVVLGGVTGVLNNIGNLSQKKANGSPNNMGMHSGSRSSTSILPIFDSVGSVSGSRKGRSSEDSLQATPIVHTQPPMVPPMERRPSYNSIAENENDRVPSSGRSSLSGRRSANHSRDPSRAPSRRGTPISSPIQGSVFELRLPPPPSDIPDDYGSQFETSSRSLTDSGAPRTRTSTGTGSSLQSPGPPPYATPRRTSVPVPQTPSRKQGREPTPISEDETRVAVELLFAVINELYTLSSAWNIRRTLLAAAKTYLLRPGNPSLSSIQQLIQDSIIVSNTSDAGVASHLRKLRENTLPTAEELKQWPPELSMEEKERLRIKARKLLIERGIPVALTGVMGQAATGEAMGKVFDCLQIQEVARGLIFGLLLQGVRAVTQ